MKTRLSNRGARPQRAFSLAGLLFAFAILLAGLAWEPAAFANDLLYNNPGVWQVTGDSYPIGAPLKVWEGSNAILNFTVINTGTSALAVGLYHDPDFFIYGDYDDNIAMWHTTSGVLANSAWFKMMGATGGQPWEIEDLDYGLWEVDITFKVWDNLDPFPPVGPPFDTSGVIAEYVQVLDTPEGSTWLYLLLGAAAWGGVILPKMFRG